MKPKPNPLLATRSATALEENTRFLTFELERAGVDQAARTVPLSFSSEAPVERWFGSEVLDHSPSAVRLARLNNGGALLMDHDRNDQIGVVESATIGADRKGRAIVRFGKSARAEEIFQDVLDGIRRLVSVGYRIHKKETESKPGGLEVERVTDWEPYEISIVSIPADDSVGVGRGVSPAPGTSNHNSQNHIISMNTETPSAPVVAAPEAAATRSAEAPAAPVITAVRESAPAITGDDLQRAISTERSRVASISAIADQARSQGINVDDQSAVRDGLSADQFRAQVFDAVISRQVSYSPGTPSRSEARDLESFSIGRGIQAVISGRPLEGAEREMHEEAQREAKTFGIGLNGQFSVPMIALQHGKRDLTATGGTAGDQGGNTIVTTQGSFIELLYNKLALRGLGTQFITNLQGNFQLPKMVTGTAPAKATENAALGESSPTTGLVSFTPKRAGRFVEYSKQLLAQSPLAWESILRSDLSTALAVLMETAAINGGGSDEPTGILGTAGIGSVAGGTNGLALTRANAIKLKTAVAAANADMGSLGFLTNAVVRGKAQETPIDAGSGLFLWKEDRDDTFMGYKAAVTNSVPSSLTKGSASGVCSAMIFGNFADSVLAQWGGIDFTVNPYIKDTEGLIRITADCFYDFGIRRAQSFAAIQDLLTQ